MKSRKRRYIQNTSEDDSDKENDELRLHLTIAPDEEKELMGQKRYFSTLDVSIFIFDREDLNVVYQLIRIIGELERLHSSSGVLTLVTETRLVIHMLVEKKYPLRKEVLMQMLKLKLESEEDSTMALELIRHKNWLVHKQTACGKDFSNHIYGDNLPKIVGLSTHLASVLIVAKLTIWFFNAPCYGNEALASPKANELTIPEQTATGKGTSNPLMAGSLPKTTKPT
ncbi:hypothetical protein Tco_0823008 [Tanacetum coccineum]|uniref:Uncharacterized protein n=1 Tax=Tanacetum coccineum TaxID=301880 RepID=A0ABQ5ALK9_9ASTR